MFVLQFSCTNKSDFNGEYATNSCPYFGYSELNPSIKIYEEGGKQFIEFNGKTYIGELEGKKLNFFESPTNIPMWLEKNKEGGYMLNPYRCVYNKI